MSSAAPAHLAPRRPGQRPLFDSVGRRGPELEPRAEAGRLPGGGSLTLERRLAGPLESLAAARAAPCPVCDGQIELAGEVARCRGCRSELG